MAKYINRLAARLAREKLRESKAWVVSKKLILETDEGDVELEKGDMVDLGATPEGDLAVKSNAAAVVVIADADLASKIADSVVSSDELSDVEFVTRDAVDTVLGGEPVDDVIGKMADEAPADEVPAEGEDEKAEVEVGECTVAKKESVESKFAKFAANPIVFNRSLACESILVDEEDEAPMDISTISQDSVAKEPFFGYEEFVSRVSELGGSVQPGEVEKALDANGKMIGYFDKATSQGMIYPESGFESEEDMMNVPAEAEPLMDEPLEGEEQEMTDAVEEALSCYESSQMTGADYMKMVESLKAAKLSESTVAKIAGSFGTRTLAEGCKVFDTELGKTVCVKESGTDADNWIVESGAEKRFTKRYFKA
jgi:hypothetical protein